jgi:hypothetical protein
MAEECVHERLLGQSRGRWWAWSVLVVAIPALASPFLFVPFSLEVPRSVLGTVFLVCLYPRLWASLATVLAVLGAKRWAESWWQLAGVSCILILA